MAENDHKAVKENDMKEIEKNEVVEVVETQGEKGEMKMVEVIEEVEQVEQIEEGNRVFTISEEMVVVETINLYSNPSSYSYEAMKLFLDNNFSIMKEYFEDGNNNGIAFYECGFNGNAQQDFIKEWLENGVKVF